MKVTLTDHVSHNGEKLEAGDIVDLPQPEAEALIDAGVAVAVNEKKLGKAEVADK